MLSEKSKILSNFTLENLRLREILRLRNSASGEPNDAISTGPGWLISTIIVAIFLLFSSSGSVKAMDFKECMDLICYPSNTACRAETCADGAWGCAAGCGAIYDNNYSPCVNACKIGADENNACDSAFLNAISEGFAGCWSTDEDKAFECGYRVLSKAKGTRVACLSSASMMNLDEPKASKPTKQKTDIAPVLSLPKKVPVPVFSPRSLSGRMPNLYPAGSLAISNYDPEYGVSEAEQLAMQKLIEKMRDDGFDTSIPYDPSTGVSEGTYQAIIKEIDTVRQPPTLSYSTKKNLDSLNTCFQVGTWVGFGTAVAAGWVALPVALTVGVTISLAGGTGIEYAKQTGEATSEGEKLEGAVSRAAPNAILNALSFGMGQRMFDGGPSNEIGLLVDEGLNNLQEKALDLAKQSRKRLESYKKSFSNDQPVMLLNLPLNEVEMRMDQRFGGRGLNVPFIPSGSKG